MSTFFVLCLIAVAYADNLGYNYQPGSGLNKRPPVAPNVEPKDFNTEYYHFEAPEEKLDEGYLKTLADSLRKPEPLVLLAPKKRGLEDAALNGAKQAADQKSDVYVLNKQSDMGHLVNKRNALNRNSMNKPELRFLEYHTQEDAVNSLKAI